MPHLTLMFDDKMIDQYALEYGNPLTIGRKEVNHIVISNLAVSSNHARVELKNDGVYISDLDSKNGTFVNGHTITTSRLKDGDEIIIGKHRLFFSEAEGGKRVNPGGTAVAPSVLDATMVLDTTQHRDMISNILAGSKKADGTKRKSPIPVLLYIKGGEGKVVLRNKFTRIGKETGNDIIAKGFFVGGRAATVTRRNDGYYISHMKGWARTCVNGEKVKEARKLEHADVITLGSLKMKFLSKPKKNS
jgi:pSer/pThr/pTyr-binding forkhead associated (FHA) protein